MDSTFRDRARDSLGRRGGEREDEVRVRGRTVSLIPSASASARTQSPAAASELAWREPRSNIPDELSGNRNTVDAANFRDTSEERQEHKTERLDRTPSSMPLVLKSQELKWLGRGNRTFRERYE